jgi:3-oxoacyl-[acyl-carrier protein] reductase
MNKDSAKEKLVVITGATKGLGRALSLEFANAGYEVLGLYRADATAANDLAAEFAAKNFRGIFIKQDIAADGDWAEFDALLKNKADRHLTVIANACPPFVPKPFHLTEWSEFGEQTNVNVKGAFHLLKRLLPSMAKARRGNVIAVSTAALDSPPKGFAAYLTAKSALEGLTRTVAAEYNARGIRVFSVSPGFMETSLTSGWSEHLKTLIYADGAGAQSPDENAKKIFALTEDSETAGQGENYLLGAVAGKDFESKNFSLQINRQRAA